jgi:hypothetical protein
MNQFKMLCLIVLTSLSAFAQDTIKGKQDTIKGKVIRKDSSAIVSASVNIIGTAIQVNSDVIGDFTIVIPDSLADKEIVLYTSKKGYLSAQRIIESEERQGRPVIIMLTKYNLESAAVSPPPPSPPTNSSLPPTNSSSTTTSALPPQDSAVPPKSLPPGQQVPMFPWPPPEYSVSAVLDKSYFKQSKTMFDVDDILTTALSDLGYYDRSYFEIPNGFALVNRIEQIKEDGAPFAPPARWSVTVKAYDRLSWSAYLKALVFPPSGFFRIIVFAVTDNSFTSSRKKVTKAAAEQWLKSGVHQLPASIGNKKLGPNHLCMAIIYEFKKVASKEAEQITGDLTGMEHLEKSGLIPLVRTD